MVDGRSHLIASFACVPYGASLDRNMRCDQDVHRSIHAFAHLPLGSSIDRIIYVYIVTMLA
jgi:hypothetical protein